MISLLGVILFISFCCSLIYFSISLTIPDTCYTKPCLSTEYYPVNPLKIDVASSVSAVTFSALLTICPLFGLYLLYMRTKYYIGGMITGIFMVLSLVAWIQAILWFDQHSKILLLSDVELRKFGTKYLKNHELELKSIILSFVCVVIAILDSIAFLILYFKRDEYCIDINISPHNVLRSYQAITTMESLDEE